MPNLLVVLRVDSDEELVPDWREKDRLRSDRGFPGWIGSHGFGLTLPSDVDSEADARAWGESVGPNLWRHMCRSLDLPDVPYTELSISQAQTP